jgi:hypothetical protein
MRPAGGAARAGAVLRYPGKVASSSSGDRLAVSGRAPQWVMFTSSTFLQYRNVHSSHVSYYPIYAKRYHFAVSFLLGIKICFEISHLQTNVAWVQLKIIVLNFLSTLFLWFISFLISIPVFLLLLLPPFPFVLFSPFHISTGGEPAYSTPLRNL